MNRCPGLAHTWQSPCVTLSKPSFSRGSFREIRPFLTRSFLCFPSPEITAMSSSIIKRVAAVDWGVELESRLVISQQPCQPCPFSFFYCGDSLDLKVIQISTSKITAAICPIEIFNDVGTFKFSLWHSVCHFEEPVYSSWVFFCFFFNRQPLMWTGSLQQRLGLKT